ncbi:MFS transporter [Rhodanobacter sp. C05]|uniref:MFS transporter n=1 Tax=Rhodanobacter sp. C05 TaxID=1945855 RepID=UPI00098743BF|nr:MFS transporter [Rhodanobacter sp. C05]OOG37370.1 MFS transporter [Rhodanobacter sp. C05]
MNDSGSAPLAKSLTLAAMSLGYGVVQLDVTIVNTALRSIGTSLGGGVSELQWIVSTYTIAFAALILTAGALGDRIGAKKVFMAGFAIFTGASLACALAPTAVLLIAARAAQGMGAAILVPNSLALLNHAYPDEKERGRAVGIWAAGASLALTAGPLAGGALIALVGWRSIFLVNLPIGLAGLWLTWRYASETPRSPHHSLDLGGQAAAIGALGCLAGAIIEGGTHGWSNPWVLAGFAAFTALAVAFVFQERRARQPMLPLSLFRHRLFALTSAIGLLVNVAFYGLIFVLSLYFQQINGLSPLATGLAFLPMMGAVLPANLLAARATERFGAPAIIAIGATMAAVGCMALLGTDRGTSYGSMCVQLVAIGAGLGLLVPPLTSTLLGSVEKKRSGIAAGVLNATRQTGSVLGVALFGAFVAKAGAFIFGTRESLMMCAILLLGAAVTIMVGGRSRN